MRLSKEFDVTATRARACEVLAEDATLTSLFPDTKTDIVARTARRRTAKSAYTLLISGARRTSKKKPLKP